MKLNLILRKETFKLNREHGSNELRDLNKDDSSFWNRILSCNDPPSLQLEIPKTLNSPSSYISKSMLTENNLTDRVTENTVIPSVTHSLRSPRSPISPIAYFYLNPRTTQRAFPAYRFNMPT
ncbi:hypothetical protein CEXT_300071 [Caerostris extrusa]|uniref:Uncharacterized protein n=1 Tax=Caerostris extrusa TaxID=172846 RepID=A0AAV4MTM8_CAEEX|nr:hypothetical protein CEXT_300071 [Caerostris extrusa]